MSDYITRVSAKASDMFCAEDWPGLLRACYRHAQYSPDPSTQVAAMVLDRDGAILSLAKNEFPLGVLYLPERWERPGKYKYIEHAERNSLYECAQLGFATGGATMVAPWAACADCARAIIQCGLARLVRHKQAGDRSPAFWAEEIAYADTMLAEAGVEVIDVDADLSSGVELLHSGQLWVP